MRHQKAGRQLGRNASHRKALFRNLAMAVFRHERIVTTVAKAKEAKPFIEKLITLAKEGTLHARRRVLAQLGPPSKAEVAPSDDPEKGDSRHVIIKLFDEIAPRYQDRKGGYLRVLKRETRRLGDAGETAFLELVKAGETRERKKKAPAAPVVAPTVSAPAQTPAPVAAAPEPTPTPEPPAPETPPAS